MVRRISRIESESIAREVERIKKAKTPFDYLGDMVKPNKRNKNIPMEDKYDKENPKSNPKRQYSTSKNDWNSKAQNEWNGMRSRLTKEFITEEEAAVVKKFLEKLKELESLKIQNRPYEDKRIELQRSWEELKLNNNQVLYLSVKMVGRKLRYERSEKKYWDEFWEEISR